MSFISIEFFVLLGVVWSLHWSLPTRLRNPLLLVASYVFYGWWDWRFLSLILLSTLVDFAVGVLLGRTTDRKSRRALVTTSVLVNLGILGTFKYLDFFRASTVALAESLGVGQMLDLPTLHIVLPIGISFYTFQTLSYSIDVYRGQLRPTHSLLNFGLYVAFFPQLVAGPIERASHLLPEIESERSLSWDAITRGCFLILFGFFKKVAIADGVSERVNFIFASSSVEGGFQVVVAAYLFALQIYADFSAYSDIARGSAKLLGFELIHNFDTPYFSKNPSEFWRRWHISLSSWLRDYLYVPLGGNRAGSLRTYRNLSLTMLLGGLWHGAAWNFVLWGGYQGLLLICHRVVADRARRVGRAHGRLWSLLSMFVFFQLVCYGWLLFRADGWPQIVSFTQALFTGWGSFSPAVGLSAATWAAVGLLFAIDLAQYRTGDTRWYRRLPVPIRILLYAALIHLSAWGLSNHTSDFIYFQF